MNDSVTLRFTVKHDILKKDLTTPFNEMHVGSLVSYIAEFKMDESWNGYSCIACFANSRKQAFVPIISGKAEIPNDILSDKKFSVSVIGQKNGKRLSTNENQVIQTGGK